MTYASWPHASDRDVSTFAGMDHGLQAALRRYSWGADTDGVLHNHSGCPDVAGHRWATEAARRTLLEASTAAVCRTCCAATHAIFAILEQPASSFVHQPPRVVRMGHCIFDVGAIFVGEMIASALLDGPVVGALGTAVLHGRDAALFDAVADVLDPQMSELIAVETPPGATLAEARVAARLLDRGLDDVFRTAAAAVYGMH